MTDTVAPASPSTAERAPDERAAAEPSGSGSTRTVERALELLAQVCAERSISLSECARRADLPTSTALRLLRTLEQADFVSRSEQGHFAAGARLIQLGASALSRESLVPLSQPSLRRLVASSGESAYVSVRGPGSTALYAGMVEGTHSVRHSSWVGRTVPLSGTAVGLALAGKVPEVGYVGLRSAVEPDVTAIAAPIRRPDGVVGALSLVGPTYRIDDDQLVGYGELVAAEAHRISQVFLAEEEGRS